MTSEPKWTPGPWHYGRMRGWGDDICITRRPAADYGPQGTVGDCPLAQVYARAPHWENSYPSEANASLIAAAPELYEALEPFVTFHSGHVLPPELSMAMECARAALAKARGE